jgi:biopolymer transport protein ExbD
MSQTGLLIRLIDVGLIILMGFIMISDITVKAQIKLPSSDPQAEEERPQTIILVNIDRRGTFSVTIPDRKERISGLADTRALEEALLSLRERFAKEGQDIVVLVEPDEDSIIQRTVDVLDICQRHGILKNINYASLEL